MSKFKLKISTPCGEFTRTATRLYTHAVVRNSPRAMEAHQSIAAGRTNFTTGVNGRWHKDRGYATTWHGSEAAAIKAAASPYEWDGSTEVVGIFPVQQR